MLIPTPVAFRRRRGRIKAAASSPVVGALTLVSASFADDDPATLTLAFSRAINLAGVVGSAVVVDDAQQTYLIYNATGGAELIDPVTVQFTLVSLGESPGGPGELLTVASNNGIVAVDGGAAWVGVVDLVLPFP